MSKKIVVGGNNYSAGERAIAIVNSNDRDWTNHRYLFTFGAYGDTHVLVWANSLDDGLDEAIDWLVEHAPGHIVDEQVAEEYKLAIADGLDEEDAQARAEEDTTCGGNCGNYILSFEWFVIEDPTREILLALQGREIARAS